LIAHSATISTPSPTQSPAYSLTFTHPLTHSQLEKIISLEAAIASGKTPDSDQLLQIASKVDVEKQLANLQELRTQLEEVAKVSS
jgi:hypothetical protein